MTPEEIAQNVSLGPAVRKLQVLGCDPATVGSMRRGITHTTGKPSKIDRRTALACAALAAGLDEWRPPATGTADFV